MQIHEEISENLQRFQEKIIRRINIVNRSFHLGLSLSYYNRKEYEHQLLTNHFHTGITSSTMTKTITGTQVNLQLDNIQGTME